MIIMDILFFLVKLYADTTTEVQKKVLIFQQVSQKITIILKNLNLFISVSDPIKLVIITSD